MSKVFGPSSVTLGLHPIAVAVPSTASALVEGVIEQAVAAERSGFDGATVSEHHRGLPGYLPQPLLVSNWVLAETSRIWSGPNPTLLTLRNAAHLAEELAWTAARFPGRVGATVAAGYNPDDFAAVGLGTDDIARRFAEEVTHLAHSLTAGGPLQGDEAVEEWIRTPGPLASAANSTTAAVRAANAGMGISLIGADNVSERTQRVLNAYRGAGGTGPVMLTRRAFIGTPPAKAVEALLDTYRTSPRSNGALGDFVSGEPEAVAEALVVELDSLGPDGSLVPHLNLPGVELSQALEQIVRFGEEVIPLIKRERGVAGASS
ncbi:MAG: LLM class flavin-dependent oxidoreductase [Cryobacterium sp.]|nr:LLM class flavin-dependent oxidoreductase [Cryobacterium sp.]